MAIFNHSYISKISIQVDHSGCDKPPVNIETKVLFSYEERILKHNICFDVNGRIVTT